MNFSTISVLLFLIYVIIRHDNLSNYISDLRTKYNVSTWHSGFFADAKLRRILEPEDFLELKKRSKKVNLLFLYFIIYTLLIFSISGLLFKSKL